MLGKSVEISAQITGEKKHYSFFNIYLTLIWLFAWTSMFGNDPLSLKGGNDVSISESTSFFKALKSDFVSQATFPLHLQKNQLIGIGAGAITTTILILKDRNIDHFFSPVRDKRQSFSRFNASFTELGGNYGLGLSALFAGYSLLSHNEKGIETSALLGEALITSSIWTRLIKLSTGRARPFDFYITGDHRWGGPIQQFTEKNEKLPPSYFDAFPSGHTATAFSIATVFATQYSDIRAVPIVSYSLAALVGVSRIIEHQHWSSDVFTGGLLGYFCAKQICNRAKENKEQTTTAHSTTSFVHKSKYHPSYFLNYSGKTCLASLAMTF